MKNIINITTEGEQLVSSTDDGTNTLYINDNEIPSSNWIGSGNYTDTVNGHAITIKKCIDLNGNCQLVKLSDYNYEMRKTALAGQLQMLNYIYPVGSYYETSDASFNPNTAWGGTWVKEASAALCSAENVVTRIKTFSISRARGSHADVTAPTVTDYTFIAWVATATQGWVGSVYPAQPTAQTATFWVSVSDGNTNNMNVNAVALYRKNDNSINRWHRTA